MYIAFTINLNYNNINIHGIKMIFIRKPPRKIFEKFVFYNNSFNKGALKKKLNFNLQFHEKF